ncbi:hypothetical protein J2J97_31925 (plasmid) [Rhizobium bangladeshense]|uniref:hypothetical protein n=1 Tax=Rhizobium bangladeshense TaxID=1138189 RepID=UPI001A99E999|nr:hypothetical protein [Rhizobium bangladeshense]QSY98681.1 hypothetical protein J2J97_31925 [Rhizobium bangladeshense]
MTNVTTHSRFGANLEQLRAAGVDVKVIEAAEDLSDIHLEEPKYGESLLGDLTAEEKAMFVELYRAHSEIERLSREYMGNALARIGDRIRQSDHNKPLNEAFKDEPQQMDFGNEENQLAFFRLQQKTKLLNASLWWSVGERFGCHDWSCSVRSRFRAVKVASRL